MYLAELDKITGLLDIDKDKDGFYGVPEFRRVLSGKKGIEKLTVVALVVDYLSPIRGYHENERPDKAQDMVFLNRRSMLWKSDEIQEAAIAYSSLQFDLDIEEKKMLDNLRFTKMQEINKAETTQEKITLMKELKTINESIKSFNDQNADKDLFVSSPVRNGYTLSRLEQKLENKNSFYHVESRKESISNKEDAEAG